MHLNVKCTLLTFKFVSLYDKQIFKFNLDLFHQEIVHLVHASLCRGGQNFLSAFPLLGALAGALQIKDRLTRERQTEVY